MIHFHPLAIKEVRQETEDCVSLAFEVPAELKDTFKFQQGQSLTIRTYLDGEEVRRTYSLCSSPLGKRSSGTTLRSGSGLGMRDPLSEVVV